MNVVLSFVLIHNIIYQAARSVMYNFILFGINKGMGKIYIRKPK